MRVRNLRLPTVIGIQREEFVAVGQTNKPTANEGEDMTSNIETLEEVIDRLMKSAISGSGCVYELYATCFTDAVDFEAEFMTDEQSTAFLGLARATGDYCDEPIERDADECIHFLDYMTCPAGCFG